MYLREENFFSYLNSFSCFEKFPHVAVGVSGGPDSIALVFLINKWIISKKGKLSALIFDHKIRHNSNLEASQVKDTLKNLNVDARIIQQKKNKIIKKSMEQARINRLDGIVNFCRQNNILHLFLGHHADDNIENFLIRKINGSNFEGLGSIKEISFINKLQIIRPLLKTNKKSILKFNRKNKLIFINDPSNEDMSYSRVKVRNFLKNVKYNKLVKNDFTKIKKEMPDYKYMIWSSLIEAICDVGPENIKININKLLSFDDLIIERIILYCLKFFSDHNFKVRSSKISIFVNELKKSSFKVFKLSSILIRKRHDLLVFSLK